MKEKQPIYCRGSEFEFICPDTFNEENTVQRFMLLDNGTLAICYSKGYNKGYIKWRNVPNIPGHTGVTRKSLIDFLKGFYMELWTKKIEQSLKFI